LTTEERVTIELWKNHRAYILRRFVVVEVIKVIMSMITPDHHDHLDPRYYYSGLAYQGRSRDSANLLTREGTVTLECPRELETPHLRMRAGSIRSEDVSPLEGE
jgi:hypothetical protein